MDVWCTLFEAGFIFSVIDRIFLNDRNKLSQFGHNVRRGRLASTVTASFNPVTGQMTEMSWRQNPGMKKKQTEDAHQFPVHVCYTFVM